MPDADVWLHNFMEFPLPDLFFSSVYDSGGALRLWQVLLILRFFRKLLHYLICKNFCILFDSFDVFSAFNVPVFYDSSRNVDYVFFALLELVCLRL